MHAIASTTLALLLLVGSARAALAQSGTVGLGARVRVTTASGASPGPARDTAVIEGLLAEVTDSAIAIRIDRSGALESVDRRGILQLERAAGYRSWARKAGLGALIGAGSGAALGLAIP